ncbi:DgyrCDS5101 [Dimorphilus gyrociliatus]|uniref:DgyrCDS5101 n=1 Tax=Dimorphilus gyrociliatus TaxID=2664684 RepID=A0A7I8VLI0_9ANNE|nr:DgyrCDS5101 [Dimorphilus gyrociliatus]
MAKLLYHVPSFDIEGTIHGAIYSLKKLGRNEICGNKLLHPKIGCEVDYDGCEMKHLAVLSGVVFLLADTFAITSILIPNWIKMHSSEGETRIGFFYICIRNTMNYEEQCFLHSLLCQAWAVALLAIIFGIILITLTIGLIIASCFKYEVINTARWFGFSATVCFSIAAVVFPLGFDMELIGGRAYQLPKNYSAGISYIIFIFAQWITVISELLAGKVCLSNY